MIMTRLPNCEPVPARRAAVETSPNWPRPNAETSERKRGSALSRFEPEVVWVFDRCSLIDAESYQRVYQRKSGQSLARGYYIVTWPQGRDVTTYGASAVFDGPYQNRRDAEFGVLMLLAGAWLHAVSPLSASSH